jgi:hypothetical protein
MARKGTDILAKFKKVIQIPLLPEEVAKVVAWDLTDNEIFATLQQLGYGGYSVSISYDGSADQWSVAVMGKYARCPNAGCVLYGNSPAFHDALKSALFKATIKAEGESWELLDEEPNRGILW